MVDVTCENFEELLPQILADIKAAVFVAIDTEFTGLLVDEAFRETLFDTGKDRYNKQRKNIDKFTVCQLGLAVFKSVPDKNHYTVTTYNVYLRPQVCSSHDPFFMCQSSNIEFLKKYKFDFNKWLYEGVPFMNSCEGDELANELQSVVKGDKDLNLPFKLQDHFSKIKEWASSAEIGDTTSITDSLTHTSKLLFIMAVRNLLLDLWADLENGKVVVWKVSETERKTLKNKDEDGSNLVSTLVEQLLGFTVVFRYLAQLQKPLVLHNCFLDLMFIYKQLHRHLPSSYKTFKSELHRMFPLIYDTKFLASKMKWIHRDPNNSKSEVNSLLYHTGLGSLAASLKEELPVLYRPFVTILPHGCKYDGDTPMYHEAGYDAYLTGYCFLSLSHLHAMLQLPSRTQHRPMSPREHLYALKAFVNRVQFYGTRTYHMNLEGSDPTKDSPPLLLVETRKMWASLSPALVSSTLSNYSNIEVRPFNRRAALVATTSWRRSKQIYRDLSGDKILKAQVYNSFRHSPVFRTLGWSVGLVSSSLSVWLFYKTFKNALAN